MSHSKAPRAGRALRVLMVILVGAAMTPNQVGAPAQAAASVDELEACLLERVNADRESEGAAALERAGDDMVVEVREHSARMSDTTFRHMTGDERDPVLPDGTTTWAENIAWSSSPDFDDCGYIHELLMGSPPHRANILNASMRFFAPGVHIDAGGTWVTELFFAATGYETTPMGEGTFHDDDGSIFETDIEKLVAAGITHGCEERLFCPNGSVTRGQMAAFLVRALELPAAPDGGFTDTANSPFAANIDSLAAAGITTGCGSGRFCPNVAVTRGQMAAFLSRALELAPAESAGFGDTVGHLFAVDIDRLAAAGVTAGCGSDRFCPDDPVTRGQMAAFLVRALDL